MRSFTYTTKFTLAMVLLPPCLISLWMMGVPTSLSSSTYAAAATLLIAVGVVILMTYRSAQATGSMGQLLHATETAKARMDGFTAAAEAKRSEA